MKFIAATVLFFLGSESSGKCNGRFVNPVTDICWSCIFPVKIARVQVSPSNETTGYDGGAVCDCPAPAPFFRRIGLPLSYWEPAKLIDVTREKFCLVNMGGIKIGGGGVKGHGHVGSGKKGGRRHSFYQVHVYIYPLTAWLKIAVDLLCFQVSNVLDLVYVSEFDPTWNDDETAFILNPEAVIFSNPIAQAACAADSVAATSGFPIDSLFWCAGCQGGMYPFTGSVGDHIGGVQASLLLVSRILAKQFRLLQEWDTSTKGAMCQPYPTPIIIKSQFKQQMTYPIAATGKGGCRPLGRTETVWGSGKEIPYKGEDFGYLIWRKRVCCLL
jgi:conjugal transfer pilus assembly protein TraU